MSKRKGFTLIELMVVVAILAIIASIAFPAYRDSVRKGNRRAAQSVMLEIANREHQYFVANRSYATAAQLGYTLPPEVSPYYTYTIATAAGSPPTFLVTFTPTGGQASDGALTLNSLGVKAPADKW